LDTADATVPLRALVDAAPNVVDDAENDGGAADADAVPAVDVPPTEVPPVDVPAVELNSVPGACCDADRRRGSGIVTPPVILDDDRVGERDRDRGDAGPAGSCRMWLHEPAGTTARQTE
jgi:hypothetical protein